MVDSIIKKTRGLRLRAFYQSDKFNGSKSRRWLVVLRVFLTLDFSLSSLRSKILRTLGFRSKNYYQGRML